MAAVALTEGQSREWIAGLARELGDAREEHHDHDGPGLAQSTFGDPNYCVELAWSTDRTAVRDSKNATGPALLFGRQQFAQFATGLVTLD